MYTRSNTADSSQKWLIKIALQVCSQACINTVWRALPRSRQLQKSPEIFLYASCEIVRKAGNLHMNSYTLNSSQSSASMSVSSSGFLFLFAMALDVVAGAT